MRYSLRLNKLNIAVDKDRLTEMLNCLDGSPLELNMKISL